MANFEVWKKQVLGHQIDLDNQSYDCVDVAKSWAEFGSGKSWQQSLSWGNAKDIWNNVGATYWSKVGRGEGQPGDIVCMDGSIGGGFGHIAVVVERNGGNITVFQQNTFTQQPVYTGVYSASAGYIQGYLRPKFAVEYAQPALGGNQRVVGGDGVYYRKSPARSGESIKLFTAGEVLDFKGFVSGEAVDGNNKWFVGAYTGGYAWSGGFTDVTLHDLPDLTPATAIQPYQRQIGSDAMNYRKAPQVAPDNVIQVFPAGDVLDFKGYVHGQLVDGNDIWFVGKHTGGYIWSGGFIDSGTHDLADLTSVAPTPTPTPVPPLSPLYEKELACVTSVNQVNTTNYEVGNFPAKPVGTVLHDFGTDGRDTLVGSLAHFQRADTTAPHFTVSGKKIIQTGMLSWRMYHAGPQGNDKIGIEIDPDVDTNADTKASVLLLLSELEAKYGKLERHLHSEYMVTACGDDVKKAGLLDVPVPEPTPEPTPDPEPTPEVPVPKPDLLPSFIRTLVPYIVGAIVSFLATKGVNVPEDQQAEVIATLTVVLGQLYYIVVRWLETRINPRLGILLGKASAPTYKK